MSVQFRKSISAGPLRFNLSKSGIGMSAGAKGLRVGIGPRGGYVHAGRGAVTYRQSLGTQSSANTGGASTPGEPSSHNSDHSEEVETDSLEGAHVSELVAALPNDLVQRIQAAAGLRKPRFFANPVSYRRRKLDWRAESAVPLFYELEDDLHSIYDSLVDTGLALGRSPGRYYDRGKSVTDAFKQYKGHGGAGKMLDRVDLTVRTAAPNVVTLNFEPIEFAGSGRSLFLLPDQVLVQQGRTFGAIPYGQLKCTVRRSRFITEKVPAGVQPVDQTWKYLNKSGGPDRRYKDNYQIPVIPITEIDFIGPAGFEFQTAFTDSQAVDRFVSSYRELVDALPA